MYKLINMRNTQELLMDNHGRRTRLIAYAPNGKSLIYRRNCEGYLE